MKRNWLVSLAIIIVLVLAAIPLMGSAPADNNGKPVSATNVELVKKVTLKGSAGKGGKPAPVAATGTLGTSCTGTRYAIVIGINDYPGTSSDLQYCVADAEETASVLANTYPFSINKIYSLTNIDATYSGIYNAINNVKNLANADDEVVFFFSGHGAKGKANDGDRSSTDQSIVVWNDSGGWGYIWDGQLKSWFSGFPTNRIIFIFDSCLSGGMSVLKGTGRVVNMACSATGLSYEDPKWGGGHGQFTYYFIEAGMEYGKADVRADDGFVTVEEAFDYAKANCQSQTPTISDSFQNDLLP